MQTNKRLASLLFAVLFVNSHDNEEEGRIIKLKIFVNVLVLLLAVVCCRLFIIMIVVIMNSACVVDNNSLFECASRERVNE